MAPRAKWQFMDRSVTHKIVYGPQLRFGPYMECYEYCPDSEVLKKAKTACIDYNNELKK
jgi:hypothetical protein